MATAAARGLRRRTTCPVAGHGTWCSVSQEMPNRYARTTEERLALEIELAADEPGREEGRP